jgi:hypothetical protein
MATGSLKVRDAACGGGRRLTQVVPMVFSINQQALNAELRLERPPSSRSPALGRKLSASFSESPLSPLPHPVRSCE